MLEKLVSFDTVSRNSNLAFMDFVVGLLKEHGVESRLIHDETRTKANLLATIGPRVEGGVVLSGHTDVVPVDDQEWHSNPFDVVEKGGLLFGRGTADMKSFLAIILAHLDTITAAPLKTPIHLAFTYDEEVGCLGAPSLIRLINRELPKPRAVIVGEPTDMKVVSAHKGITVVRTTVTGYESHSSQTHRGVSAVMIAADLIQFLQSMSTEAADKGPHNHLFEPHHSTITVNVIDGGTATNIMAGHCTFHWDIRVLPEDNPDNYLSRFKAYCRDVALPRMRAMSPTCDIEIVAREPTPPMRLEANSDAEQLCRMLTGDNVTRAVAFAAEAGQFQQSGLSVVICGPGSISQAHQPNEFISISQVEAGTRFLHDLVGHLTR